MKDDYLNVVNRVAKIAECSPEKAIQAITAVLEDMIASATPPTQNTESAEDLASNKRFIEDVRIYAMEGDFLG